MRFQTKLLMVFVLLLMSVTSLMVYSNYRSAQDLLGKLDTNLQEIVNTVHFSTRKLSTDKGPDRDFLEQFIREFKAKKGVREVSIVSNRHEVIASSIPGRVGRPEGLSGKEIVVREELGTQDPAGHKTRYEVRVPLIRDDKVIGLVQTSIVLSDFGYLLRQAYIKNILIALAALLIACGASFFILHRLNKPIRILSSAAERVASGDLTVHVEGLGRDELGRLGASFESMIRKLAEQKVLEDRLRHLERQAILAELASTLAHEIRNPLNLINLTADHLGDRFQPGNGLRDEYRELMSSLKSEVRHLNHVVGEFLTLGKPTKPHKARFRLAELFRQVEVMVRQQLAVKRIGFRVDCPGELRVAADQEQLRLVLLNLMLNAIQAAPPGGRVSLAARPGGDRVAVTVADNGAGIKPEDLEQIFEPYFSKREGGTGLGLALVRRIVAEHGGQVLAHNAPDGGALMEFTLPAEA